MSYRSAPALTNQTGHAEAPAATILNLMRSILPNAQGPRFAEHQQDWQECCDCLRLDIDRAGYNPADPSVIDLSRDLGLLPTLLQRPDEALACIGRIERILTDAAPKAARYNNSIAPETIYLERILRTGYMKIARVALTPAAYEPIEHVLELAGGLDANVLIEAKKARVAKNRAFSAKEQVLGAPRARSEPMCAPSVPSLLDGR